MGASKLDLQFMRGQRFQFYYDGEYDIIALLDTDERQVFRKLLQEAGADWCELIVNAVAERLLVWLPALFARFTTGAPQHEISAGVVHGFYLRAGADRRAGPMAVARA